MDDQQLAEACVLQAEQTELGPALALLQKRGPLGATLIALAQALGMPPSQLQEPVAATKVSHARALAHRLAEAKVQCRQQGMEPAIYFAPQARERQQQSPPRERQQQSPPKPVTAVVDRASMPKPAAPSMVRVSAPKAPVAPEERNPRPRLSLNISLAIERDRAGQIIVSNVRVSGVDAASYEVLAQAQDEVSSADGILRSLGIAVELERR